MREDKEAARTAADLVIDVNGRKVTFCFHTHAVRTVISSYIRDQGEAKPL